MPEEGKELLSLANICEGKVDQEFQELYPALIAQLHHGEKAKITIEVELKRVANTETMINIQSRVKPTFPPRSRATIAQQNGDNTLKVEKMPEVKGEQPALFSVKGGSSK